MQCDVDTGQWTLTFLNELKVQIKRPIAIYYNFMYNCLNVVKQSTYILPLHYNHGEISAGKRPHLPLLNKN